MIGLFLQMKAGCYVCLSKKEHNDASVNRSVDKAR